MINNSPIVLVDIDGTIANIEHRLHFIVAPYLDQYDDFKKDWDSFHKACNNDSPIKEMISLVNVLANNYEVILITGRKESNRRVTTDWLITHNVRYDKLYMRPNNNFQHDYIIKPKLITEEELNRVVIAIDDRDQVVKMWRKLGIRTLQCAKGDF